MLQCKSRRYGLCEFCVVFSLINLMFLAGVCQSFRYCYTSSGGCSENNGIILMFLFHFC